MTTINAIINAVNFGLAAKRIDIWHEGSGVGRWELRMDNVSGASQILSANLDASDLGVNGTTFMKGYVDDVIPDVKDELAVFSKYVKAMGRNYGRDLQSLFLIKKYAKADWRFNNLIVDALSTAGSEITMMDSPPTAPYVGVDFNKTFLQDGFAEAAKLIDYDFTVDNAKKVQWWALASATSSG